MSQQLLNQAGVFGYNAMNALNGLLASQGIVTQGNVWWVKPNSGTDTLDQGGGQTPGRAFRTLNFALTQAVANQNDTILLCAESNTAGNTTDYQSSVLTWNKDLVHLIGINAGSFCSPRSRIAPAAAATSFAKLLTVSANGCIISGVELFQGAGSTTLSAAQAAVTVTGARNNFVGCAISGIGDATLDYAGSNSLTVSGNENSFTDCYLGLDTVIRGTAAAEVILSGTPARTLFRRCHFASYTSLSTFKSLSVPVGADRWVKLEDCTFEAAQNITGAVAPTGAIGITTMNGQVMVNRPAVYGYGLLVTGGNAYVKVLAYQNATTVQGVGASAASN